MLLGHTELSLRMKATYQHFTSSQQFPSGVLTLRVTLVGCNVPVFNTTLLPLDCRINISPAADLSRALKAAGVTTLKVQSANLPGPHYKTIVLFPFCVETLIIVFSL